MPSAYVQSDEKWINSSTNTSIALDTALSTTANNLLIANLSIRLCNTNPATPTGWTQFGTGLNYGGGIQASFWRIADGGANDNPTFTWGDQGEPTLIIVEYSGLATTGQPDSSVAEAGSGAAITSLQAGSVTPNSAPGRLIMCFGNVNSEQWRTTGPTCDLGSRDHTCNSRNTDFNPVNAVQSYAYSDTTALNPTWSTTDSGGPAMASQVCFKEISGGSPYERSLTDTTTITDGSESFRQLVKLITDSMAVLDSVVITASAQAIIERILSDVLDVADATKVYREFFKALSDDSSVVDLISVTTSGQAIIERILSEALGVEDTTKIYNEFFKGLTDSSDISDTTKNYRQFFKGLSDGLSVSDALIALLQGRIIEAVLVDQLGVTDTMLADRQFFKSLVETAIVTDELLKQSLIFRLLVEDANISDALVADITRAVRTIMLSDSLGVSDSVAIALVQVLVTWGVIEADLSREPIATDILIENIITALKKSGN